MRLEVNAATSAVNAAPMTTATARSMTFPRRMKSLKPLIMVASPLMTSAEVIPGVLRHPEMTERRRPYLADRSIR